MFTFEQGWHNCHIPVPIRCPPQLRGVEKIGGAERGGIAIAGSAEIARLTLGVCVEAGSAYSEQEHSGKTKPTLSGISASAEKKRIF